MLVVDVSHEPWVDEVIREAVDAYETRKTDAIVADVEDVLGRFEKMKQILKGRDPYPFGRGVE